MKITDEIDIALRVYTEKEPKPDKAHSEKKARIQLPRNDEPSEWSLIFDCETTTDAAQRLKVGFYQIRKSGELFAEGAFYDPDAISRDDFDIIEDFCETEELDLLTAHEFRRDVFLYYAVDLRATVIGFNLPFDISRIAIDHGPARNSMRGGFSFSMTLDRRRPRVRVKHLSRSAALIDFAAPWEGQTGRSTRNRNQQVPVDSGFFVDVKTAAAALLTFRGPLAALCEKLQTKTRKRQTDEHGGPITLSYLYYAMADVQATWECYEKLAARYASYRLQKPLHRILSEASLGKAMLQEMGVTPFRIKEPDFSKVRLGQLMSAYYGGRAEIRIRREVRRVLYCDFKSMYPTVNTLMGLWRFVIAEEIVESDVTDEIRTFVESIKVNDLSSPDIWRQLPVLVRIKPDRDLFPVRAKYNAIRDDIPNDQKKAASFTIGLNYLTADEPMWFTLADCIAAKILTGKAPEIIEAIRFEPRGCQAGLEPINLCGNPNYRVDPNKDDVFRKMVDLRDGAKAKRDEIEQSIKILTNAMSYGIFIEIQQDETASGKPEMIYVCGYDGSPVLISSDKTEQPGKYFNPIIGVMITGAARLMLAIAEQLTLNEGLEWVFCDTDSLAMARPEGMKEREFLARAQKAIDWFEALNPYAAEGSILKIEDINYGEE